MDADVGREQGVAGRQPLVGVGAVVDAAHPLPLGGVILGPVGPVGDDQRVLVAPGGRTVGRMKPGLTHPGTPSEAGGRRPFAAVQSVASWVSTGGDHGEA
jgi:hypothetical protein